MSKQTHGNWIFFDDGSGVIRIHSENGALIAFVHSNEENIDSDARLIAAAPELLEAVMSAWTLCQSEGFEASPYGIRLRAAIAKATGK